MINTITKAINRITWRLTSNHWKANQTDEDAINYIIKFANNHNEKQLQNNELFAKLYIYVYKSFLTHYNATVFDDIPQKELHKLLDKSIQHHVEEFRQALNESENYKLQEQLGLTAGKHPATRTKEEKEKDSKILSTLEEPLVKEAWDYETVKENLNSMINSALNEY